MAISWASFNRLHEKYAKKAVPIFVKGIKRHFDKMLEAAQNNGFRNLDLVVTRVDSMDIKEAFIKVYQKAGIPMAFNEYDNLLSQSKKMYKKSTRAELRAEWIQRLEGIVLDETIPAMGSVLTTSQEIFTEFVDKALIDGLTIQEITDGLRARFSELMPWRSSTQRGWPLKY